MTEGLLLSAVYDHAPLSEVELLLQQCTTDALWIRGIDGLDILNHAVLAGRPDLVPMLTRSILVRQAQAAHGHSAVPPNNGATQPPNNENISQPSNGAVSSPHNAFHPNTGTIPSAHYHNISHPSPTPKLSPLHLACLLGDKNIILELLRSTLYAADSRCRGAAWPSVDIIRRYDSRRRKSQSAPRPDWSKTNDVVLQDLLRRTDDETSALDVAAMTHHTECVHILLGLAGESAKKKTSPLERSMELNSIYAFRLLLAELPDALTVEAVFKRALSYKRVVYLKALFEHGVDVDHALDGLNPYHVVYLYSSGMRQMTLVRSASSSDMTRHNQGLDEVTALLLEKRFDVNACVPVGSYPVYSLITALVQEKDNSPAQVPSYHINSLELLLKSGVNLNFDEVRHSAETSAAAALSPTSRCAIGRDLYTSGLDAYFSCLQSCDTWRPHIMEHLDRICLSLLEAGVNPNYLDARGETPLHVLMRTMATQHSMGHMHADLSCMCRMLLYFGADPNVRTRDGGGLHPVQLYFTTLMKLMGGVFAWRRWKSSNNVTQVLQLFYFMDGDDAIEASRNITSDLTATREEGMPQEVIDYACSMMGEYMNTVKSLQEMSRLALWKAVSRRIVNLKKLHMPRAFIAAIKELFMLDI